MNRAAVALVVLCSVVLLPGGHGVALRTQQGPVPFIPDQTTHPNHTQPRADTHDFPLSPLIKEVESLDHYMKTDAPNSVALDQVESQVKLIRGKMALSTSDEPSRELLGAKLDQLEADVKQQRAELAVTQAKALELKLKQDMEKKTGPAELTEAVPPAPPATANPSPDPLPNSDPPAAGEGETPAKGAGDSPPSGGGVGGDSNGSAGPENGKDQGKGGPEGGSDHGDESGDGGSDGLEEGSNGAPEVLAGNGAGNGTSASNATLEEDINKILEAESDAANDSNIDKNSLMKQADKGKCKKPVKDDVCDEPLAVDTHVNPDKTGEVLEGLHEGLEDLPGVGGNDTSVSENNGSRERAAAEDEAGRINRIMKHLEESEHWDEVARDKAREVLVESATAMASKLEEGEEKQRENEERSKLLLEKSKKDRKEAVSLKKELCKYKFKACAMKCSEAMCHSNCDAVHNPCHTSCELKKEPPAPKCKHTCKKKKHHCKKKCHKKGVEVCETKHLAEVAGNFTLANSTNTNDTASGTNATESVDQHGQAHMMDLTEAPKKDMMDYFQSFMDGEEDELDETVLEAYCPQEPACKKKCSKCHHHCKAHEHKCKKKCKPVEKKKCHNQCEDLKSKCKENKCKKQVLETQQVCVDTCIQAKYLCLAEALAVPWNALGIVNPGSAFPAADKVLENNPHINTTVHELSNPLQDFLKAQSDSMRNMTQGGTQDVEAKGKDWFKKSNDVSKEKNEVDKAIAEQTQKQQGADQKNAEGNASATSSEEPSPCDLSPIDLKTKGAKVEKSGQLYPFKQDYASHPGRTYRIDNGKMVVEMSDLTSLLTTPLGKSVPLVRIEIHTPAQHTVNGKRYDGEIQFVHEAKSSTGESDFFVVSEFLEGGMMPGDAARSKVLDNLISEIEGIEKPGAAHPFTIDTGSMIPSSSGQAYFYYQGSLTSTPCAKAKWYIMSETQRITDKEKSFLDGVIGPGPILTPVKLGDRMTYIDYEPDEDEEKLNTEELKAEDADKKKKVEKAAKSLGVKGMKVLEALKRHENGTESDGDLEKDLQDLATSAAVANATDGSPSNPNWLNNSTNAVSMNGTEAAKLAQEELEVKKLTDAEQMKLASIEDPEEREKILKGLMEGKSFDEVMSGVTLVKKEEFESLRDASKPVQVTKDCNAKPDEPHCKNLILTSPELVPRDTPLHANDEEEEGGHGIKRGEFDHVKVVSNREEEESEEDHVGQLMKPAETPEGKKAGTEVGADAPVGSIKGPDAEGPKVSKVVRVSKDGKPMADSEDLNGNQDEDIAGFETKCSGENPDEKCKITPNIEEGPSVMTVPQGELESTKSIGGTKVHAAGPQAVASTEPHHKSGGKKKSASASADMGELSPVDMGALEDQAEDVRETQYLSCGGCSGNTVCDHTSGKCVALN